MKKTTKGTIQRMFTEFLMREGAVEIILPNGMILEVGVTQENKYGDMEITPDYCWIVASQRNKSISMDNYNLGIRYSGDKEMVCEYSILSEDGTNVNILDLV